MLAVDHTQGDFGKLSHLATVAEGRRLTLPSDLQRGYDGFGLPVLHVLLVHERCGPHLLDGLEAHLAVATP